MSDIGIGQFSLVCIVTPEQDKAVEFYEGLGFDKRVDQPFGGGYRWIEVYLPGGDTGVALAPPPEGHEFQPQSTGITLTAKDIDHTYEAMKKQGVDVDAEIMRGEGPVPSLFWFRDPSGHTLMVVESE
ncbi:VOC family protein [Flexivirga meconopsidis]|uniref:VOC family protein n=1 Tax=Flexivirga meconopsidis TaxID=2977121 RepID=UPI00223EF4AA|nr:VOC family protein [Flexivirga meconopsidis]